MQPIEQRQQANITPHAGGHLVQYGEKTYYLTELQFTGASQIVSPKPVELPPTLSTSEEQFTFWVKVLAIATLGLGALLALLVLQDLFFPPAPISMATPAPQPQPQTVIVQPPQPERRPYRRRDCRPAGLFGWGSDCREEQGYE